MQHANRTGWVVFPPVAVELLTALAALYPPLRPAFISKDAAIASAILVLLIWASTGLLQVPLHNRLGLDPTAATIRQLVLSNWLRTLIWTARATLLSTILSSPAVRPFVVIPAGNLRFPSIRLRCAIPSCSCLSQGLFPFLVPDT